MIWKPIFVAAAVVLVSGVPVAPAELTFEKSKVVIAAGLDQETVTATFPFENNGIGPLVVARVESSCQCLRAESDKSRYEPGEKGQVTGVFKVGSIEGYAEKYLTVVTDDKKIPLQRLTVGIEVPTVVEVTPDLTQWKVGDAPATKQIRIKFFHDEPVQITNVVNSKASAFDHKVVTVKEGSEYVIELTPKTTDSVMLGVIRFESDIAFEKHRRKMAFFGIVREMRPAAAAAINL